MPGWGLLGSIWCLVGAFFPHYTVIPMKFLLYMHKFLEASKVVDLHMTFFSVIIPPHISSSTMPSWPLMFYLLFSINLVIILYFSSNALGPHVFICAASYPCSSILCWYFPPAIPPYPSTFLTHVPSHLLKMRTRLALRSLSPTSPHQLPFLSSVGHMTCCASLMSFHVSQLCVGHTNRG